MTKQKEFKEPVVVMNEPFKPNTKLIRATLKRARTASMNVGFNIAYGKKILTPDETYALGREDGVGNWPMPNSDRAIDLNWQIRHHPNEVDPKQLMLAASIMSAYRELVALPEERRNKVVKLLREASKHLTRVEE